MSSEGNTNLPLCEPLLGPFMHGPRASHPHPKVRLSISTEKRESEAGDTKLMAQGLPGGPVIKTLCFHCPGSRFFLWLGN